MKVVLVEDHEGVREALELTLRWEGCEVVSFDRGESALEFLDRELVDLVIVDWNMPKMSGGEFVRRAKERALPLFTPHFVFFSGDQGIREKANAVGVGHFLSKPFAPEELAELLRPPRPVVIGPETLWVA